MIQSNTTTLESISTRICPLIEGIDLDTELHISRWGRQYNFLATDELNAIAVKTLFLKSQYNNIAIKNIRHKISIAIIDLYDNTQVSHTSFYASLPKGVLQKLYIKTLEFTHFHTSHHEFYKVVITNETENYEMDSYDFRLIDYHEVQKTHEKVITPFHASIEAYDSQYLSVNRDIISCPNLTFLAKTKYSTTHKLLEEVDVRIYYPNGEVESTILHPLEVELTKNEAWTPIRITTEVSTSQEGVVYAELRHLGTPIAGILFNVGYDEYEGEWSDFTPIPNYTPQKGNIIFYKILQNHIAEKSNLPIEFDDSNFDELFEEFINSATEDDVKPIFEDSFCDQPQPNESSWEILNQLTGLTSVKEKLLSYKKTIEFTNLRAQKGLPTFKMPLHSMFLGAPGTGKTTIAKALGEMLAETGVLSKGHVVVKERSTLLGKYYSCEEENTLKAIEEAQGGILFIDEAYQLFDENDPRDPGRHVIDALLTELSDESKRDWMLILAGYPEQTLRLYDLNPGLKSRIPESNIYTFDDFTEVELMEIAENYLAKNQYSLTDDAHKALSTKLKADYNARNKDFGNARHVINLLQTSVLPSMAARIVDSTSHDDLTTIQECDIPKPTKKETATHRRMGFHF